MVTSIRVDVQTGADGGYRHLEMDVDGVQSDRLKKSGGES